MDSVVEICVEGTGKRLFRKFEAELNRLGWTKRIIKDDHPTQAEELKLQGQLDLDKFDEFKLFFDSYQKSWKRIGWAAAHFGGYVFFLSDPISAETLRQAYQDSSARPMAG